MLFGLFGRHAGRDPVEQHAVGVAGGERAHLGPERTDQQGCGTGLSQDRETVPHARQGSLPASPRTDAERDAMLRQPGRAHRLGHLVRRSSIEGDHSRAEP